MTALTLRSAIRTVARPRSAPSARQCSSAPWRSSGPDARERAQRSRPSFSSGPMADTAHHRYLHRHVAGAQPAAGATKQIHERIARRDGGSPGARMPLAARPVHLARNNPAEAHPGAFRAPYRPISVPHGDRRAGEGRSGDDLRYGTREGHGRIPAGATAPDFAPRITQPEPEASARPQ